MFLYSLLFFAGLIAGAMNAAAGGGSFITFPALIFTGIPSVAANASSTVALLPGSMVSAWKFRGNIRPVAGLPMGLVIGITLIGGFLGALLLLYTPASNFDRVIPWLLLTGSLAFAFGRQAGDWLRERFRIGPAVMLSVQFLLGIYGGYFGGAVGIMMMAAWSLFGLTDIRVINANKTLLVGVANSTAALLFIAAGKTAWPSTLVMMSATILGGYFGAYFTNKVDPVRLRMVVVCINFLVTVVFFVKTYLIA